MIESRLLKRAQYETFSFEVQPGRVTVRNGSYAQPREHEYSVHVVDGVPVACTCPSDEHMTVVCKHRLAVAIRSPVREAAAEDGTLADGGLDTASAVEQAIRDGAAGGVERERVQEDCACPGMPDGVPCWPCYRACRKTFDD